MSHPMEVLKKYKIKPDLNLDQNFMIDSKLIKKITNLGRIKNTDVVLEIGPGPGFLTKELAKHSKLVIAVEKDKNLVKILRKETSHQNVKIIEGNILKHIKNLTFDKIISNPPYSVLESLFQKLIYCDFDLAVFTIPEHFKDILFAEENDKQYSKLSVILQAFFSFKHNLIALKTQFYPHSFNPKDHVITMRKLTKKEYQESPEKYITKEIFLQKNKMLKNAITEAIILESKPKKMTKNSARKQINTLNLNKTVLEKRVKDMVLEDFMSLSANLRDHYK